MNPPSFRFYMHYRARREESIETRHGLFASKMQALTGPLSWRQMSIPSAPDCGDELGASFWVKYNTPSLKLEGRYVYRGDTYVYDDEVFYDDKVWITWNPDSQRIDYKDMLSEHLASAILAFGGYAGHGYFASHTRRFEELHLDKITQLRARPGVDVNGRNNIFTLNVVQYWDRELCQKALGYGPDEVIRRLTNKVPLVRPLMDGVYTVFNDDPNLSFEEFCAYNDQLKPILGLI